MFQFLCFRDWVLVIQCIRLNVSVFWCVSAFVLKYTVFLSVLSVFWCLCTQCCSSSVFWCIRFQCFILLVFQWCDTCLVYQSYLLVICCFVVLVLHCFGLRVVVCQCFGVMLLCFGLHCFGIWVLVCQCFGVMLLCYTGTILFLVMMFGMSMLCVTVL